jgi:hypothetical protein
MDRALVLREQPLCGRVLPELGADDIRDLIHSEARF